ncbi:NADP-dependent 3-hydroxy acid dehydrogenase YdfG [Nannocystis exedens]|uniref:NADP-dependent 3-hydroxy acid dehydrogenase YdfG n=2 Tax=Nannocystis exedens TaxID=54 RepID=A0A1I2GLM1_9BACT|nr:short-chain dehydrogenase/reductase [Nannocystis exedens]SFF17491.1 NADP-dependent 3-hydroxy acid dehydrogenase YdfG [Nannocystis exedens]
MANAPCSPRVWFITGAGRGLGRAFVEGALAAGERVVATLRRPEVLRPLVEAHPALLRTLALDVRDRSAVFTVVEQAHAAFGRLDVVINNAGYGLVGAVEEVSEAEAREQMDTNFFGALWVTQAVLPVLRAQRSGHIVQISSVGGVGTMPAFGLYNASKWALEAFSEALAAEVADLGIRVTIAELGGFATDWAWGSMRFASGLPAYDPLRERTFGTTRLPWDMSQQPSDTSADPREAAAALARHLTDEGTRPLRLIVGADAPEHVSMALAKRRDDYRKNPGFAWPA